jgi:hypothetical protein
VSATADAVTKTVSDTVQTVTQTVSGTTEALTSTVVQTIATAGAGVGLQTPSTIVNGAAQMPSAATFAPAPSHGPIGTQPATTTPGSSPRAPVVADAGDVEPDVARLTFIQPGVPNAATTQAQLAAPQSRASGLAGLPTGTPALSSAEPDDATRDRASVPRAPHDRLPGLPSSLTALLAGSGASVSFGLAALLGALLLTAFGRPGTRLKPGAAVFRPPDVFTSLERPG